MVNDIELKSKLIYEKLNAYKTWDMDFHASTMAHLSELL